MLIRYADAHTAADANSTANADSTADADTEPMPTPELAQPTNPVPINPISYNPEIGINYARKWAIEGRSIEENHNPEYERFDLRGGWDCANFGSQILHEAGLPMTKEWYYDKESGFASDAWRLAHEHYKYFSNKENGYIEGEEIKITSLEELDNIFKSGVVEKGDLLYWDFTGDGEIDHTTVISSVDGELKYTAHTTDKFDASVETGFRGILERASNNEEPTLHIVRLKKEVPKHEEPGWWIKFGIKPVIIQKGPGKGCGNF